MSEIRRIGPEDAHRMMGEGYTYVDVRTEEEFAQGHPEGAVNVPVLVPGASGMSPNPDFEKVMTGAFAATTKVIVGCKAGGRSMRAAQILAQRGFTEVIDQKAGWDGARNEFGEVVMPGWSRAGLPVETGASPGRGYAEMKKKAGL